MKVALIIPTFNEEAVIAETLAQVPADLYAQIIVADNGSTDRTAALAEAAGAEVVSQPERGYGAACLAGIDALTPGIDIVVFMDADGSDVPAEAKHLIDPIATGQCDFVIGSRELGRADEGSLAAHQRFGNALTVALVEALHGRRYSDLGPFRAIRRTSLAKLGMKDRNYGWTIEMQIKALKQGLRVEEVSVSYRRRRAGRSKVSGNIWGSLAAGVKILWTVARLSLAAS